MEGRYLNPVGGARSPSLLSMNPYTFTGGLLAQYIKLPYTVQLSLRGILNLLHKYGILKNI